MLPIVCLDLDGTLLDAQVMIHPRDVKIIKEREDVQFILTTGRPLHSVRRALERSGLFANQPIPLPLVLQSGAAVYGPGEVQKSYTPFPVSMQRSLIDLFRQYPQVSFVLFGLDEIFILWPHPLGLEVVEKFELELSPGLPDPENYSYSKVLCVSEEKGLLQELVEETGKCQVEGAFSGEHIFEVTPPGVDKAVGLKSLLEILELSENPIYGAGDSENDLPIFNIVEKTFAPDSAMDHVRDTADHVVDRGEEGLLAAILDKIGGIDAQG